MINENNTDTLLLTAKGPVEKTLTYEEGQITHTDVDADNFTAETAVEGHQEIHVTLDPIPDLTDHVDSGFEDSHMGLVTWIFASYLDNAEEGWYPIRYDEWDITLTTAKPGAHPDNLFRLCAKEQADQTNSTPDSVLRGWMNAEYFDTEKIREVLEVI